MDTYLSVLLTMLRIGHNRSCLKTLASGDICYISSSIID